MIRKFLSGIAPVLICLAPPVEGGGGGNDPQPASPTGDTPEAKYSSALKIIGDYFKQLAGAFKERDDEQAAHKVTKQSLKDEQDQHTATKGLLKAEQDAHSATKTQITGLTTERDTARSRTTLIESFAKHHGLDLVGLDKFKALTEVPEAEGSKDGKALYDQWQALKNAGEGKKATAFFRKHKAELNEYAESTR